MKITAHGVATHYQRIGQATQVLVLLHGWGCDWQIWAPVIPQLSDSFQLLIPDLPAFGQSAAPTKVWDSYEYRDWLADFLHQTVKNDHVAIAGHSFGGKIAALYAAQAAPADTTLSRLIIVDASGLPVDLTLKEQLVQGLSRLLPEGLKQKLNRTAKARILKSVGVASDYQHATDYQQQVLKKIVRENIAADLKKITIPTQVIWGAKDETTPLSQGRLFAAGIPGAKLTVMNKSGHYPFVDETQLFIKAVTTFL